MREVTLFIAMSLDGFIADREGGVDWLGGQEPGQEDMVTYERFVRDVDTVIMGWNTYQQIRALSPGQWPYQGMSTYVLTHRELPAPEEVRFVREEPARLVERLKEAPGKGIWLCGGANTAQQFLAAGCIDILHLNVMPILLGEGLRLFEALGGPVPLRLLRSESYNGITDLVYTLRSPLQG